MSSEQLKQKIFENMIEVAVQEHCDELADMLLPENRMASPHQFSAEFNKRTKKLVLAEKRQQNKKHNRKAAKKAAAIVLVAFIGLSVAAMSVEAVRTTVINFFVSVQDEYTSVKADSTDSEPIQQISERFAGKLPTYIPDGFIIKQVNEYEKSLGLTYEKNNGDKILFSIHMGANDVSFDTEDAQMNEIKINGKKAFISEKATGMVLLMFHNENAYQLSGNIDQKTAVKIMQSIES
ncbi:DUF4367 domain-containing protein [Hydrogenoanaerobacterium sp.]|uniref:DUF4367 domain-containing protein n=1 Tax=Hydrogenoanaerobacterium sp. TaxID=2953763 RepID=UPI00289F61CE|nr:DUF4367 domain-containing protein [Hydrogenoanaerobacterium sp.]